MSAAANWRNTAAGSASRPQEECDPNDSPCSKAIKKSFPPEFINRVDEQVFFNTLTRDDIERSSISNSEDLRERTAKRVTN